MFARGSIGCLRLFRQPARRRAGRPAALDAAGAAAAGALRGCGRFSALFEGLGAIRGARIFPAQFCLLAALVLLPAWPGAAGAAAAQREEQSPPPYIQRDGQDGRGGLSVGSGVNPEEGGFSTDPESGSRRFRTFPPPEPQGDSSYPEQIWVSPEVRPGTGPGQGWKPGHPGQGWKPGHPGPGGKPGHGWKPGASGQAGSGWQPGQPGHGQLPPGHPPINRPGGKPGAGQIPGQGFGPGSGQSPEQGSGPGSSPGSDWKPQRPPHGQLPPGHPRPGKP
ncbi:hypothetical protein LJC36_05790 [Desulfovibrio sp. OttesenSCG-928-C14]|nr:hypothetical protein [Desulfovibrio sp. OttesenSCG-928-C14]